MKYIRTYDGRIIDCVKLMKDAKKHILQNEDDYKLACVLSLKTYDTSLGWKRRVIKQADTIKELCDGFVRVAYETKTAKRSRKPYWTVLLRNLDDQTASGYINEVYGFIWIFDSNGAPTLKPVAKLDEKGELELL